MTVETNVVSGLTRGLEPVLLQLGAGAKLQQHHNLTSRSVYGDYCLDWVLWITSSMVG